ncbi:uncharacterized protein I303_101987 [Kwoniella dejecticola CBS 10117]|uniref:HSF-type DNA-binding domain-containing protein n=1 Tax=Kwoniella dejecticola CBS 10117 TaxID=1296121 RepID=A0A1A6ACA1_9TREE|nr:uncharacterized protein I303_01876 [Kwoniella dejecticola CBS 10117]OBR87668.1 hypothetical protein I303_01876 [Kwoniella dejecticola CBS 10117]
MPHVQPYETSPERAVGRYTAANGGSKPPNFLQKLYDFLSLDPHPCPESMYWASDSKQLVIAQPEKLAKEVLPKLFKHDKIASFGRQLNIYGFSRLFPGRQFKDANGNISDASVWAHPTLNRLSTPTDLLSIKRRAPPKLIRTRRLANGEIIKTKASQNVIEKARQLKQDMLVSKTKTHPQFGRSTNNKLGGETIYNTNDSSRNGDLNTNAVDQHQPASTWDNPQAMQANSAYEPSLSAQMRRNDTFLSDITEYTEPQTSSNSTDSVWPNSIPHLTPSFQTSPLNGIGNATIQPLAYSEQQGLAATPVTATTLTSSYDTSKPLLNPLTTISERLWSSCPASIHTSPSAKHTSLPIKSTWSHSASINNNNANSNSPKNSGALFDTSDLLTLTSSIDTYPQQDLSSLSFQSNANARSKINTDTNINHFQADSAIGTHNAIPKGSFPLAVSPSVMPQGGLQPSRIAAPAAPIPSHLLQTQAERQLINPSIRPQGMTIQTNGAGPFRSPISTSGLSSSWNKNVSTNSLWSNNTGLGTGPPCPSGKPMILGNNGNGTIDPRWISPINSEWSTPSITRNASPTHTHTHTHTHIHDQQPHSYSHTQFQAYTPSYASSIAPTATAIATASTTAATSTASSPQLTGYKVTDPTYPNDAPPPAFVWYNPTHLSQMSQTNVAPFNLTPYPGKHIGQDASLSANAFHTGFGEGMGSGLGMGISHSFESGSGSTNDAQSDYQMSAPGLPSPKSLSISLPRMFADGDEHDPLDLSQSQSQDQDQDQHHEGTDQRHTEGFNLKRPEQVPIGLAQDTDMLQGDLQPAPAPAPAPASASLNPLLNLPQTPLTSALTRHTIQIPNSSIKADDPLSYSTAGTGYKWFE